MLSVGLIAVACFASLSVQAPAPQVFPGTSLVVDRFANAETNQMGNWHGCDEDASMITCRFNTGSVTITANDVDYGFYTQFNNACQDIRSLESQYLHITLTGSSDFTVMLQQHNAACNEGIAPFPETQDVVRALDYDNLAGDIYIPMSHFNINKTRAVGFAFKGFRAGFFNPTTIRLVEIVPTLPWGRTVPAKKATGALYYGCTRPNSIAFGIDDGDPQFAQQAMKAINDAGIKVTFFTRGDALLDTAANFSNVLKEALAKGHQVATHSMTHPKLESLIFDAGITSEIQGGMTTALAQLGNQVSTKYFRAPYGTDGAITRQRTEQVLGPGSRTIAWTIDIEDWIWGESTTPQNQLTAVQRDLAKGGTIFVAHYLYQSTVDYLPQFIAMAKATGKQIMRIDQCLQDPAAPPL